MVQTGVAIVAASSVNPLVRFSAFGVALPYVVAGTGGGGGVGDRGVGCR